MDDEVKDGSKRASVLNRIGRFNSAPRTVSCLIRDFSLMIGGIFAMLFMLTAGLPLLTGASALAAGANAFVGGLAVLTLGFIISYSWLGEKEDYSRTAYVTKTRGMGFIYARTNPGPKPSERTREERKSATLSVNLIGLSVIVAAILLMVSSVFLG